MLARSLNPLSHDCAGRSLRDEALLRDFMKFITVLAVLLPVVYALPYSSDWTPKATKVLRVERVEDGHDQVVFGLKEMPQSSTHDQITQRPVPSFANQFLLFLSRMFDDFTEKMRIVLGGDSPDIAYDGDGVRYEVSTRCDENNRRVRVLRIKSKGQPATYRVYPISGEDGAEYCRRRREKYPEA
ncbi:hypothetical protein NCS52_00273100 [Fusarium sp. LHS14.1]|nr:hypothetical protein NCS52_00273100 [Fusarium sp. LHS14.1]